MLLRGCKFFKTPFHHWTCFSGVCKKFKTPFHHWKCFSGVCTFLKTPFPHWTWPSRWVYNLSIIISRYRPWVFPRSRNLILRVLILLPCLGVRVCVTVTDRQWHWVTDTVAVTQSVSVSLSVTVTPCDCDECVTVTHSVRSASPSSCHSSWHVNNASKPT